MPVIVIPRCNNPPQNAGNDADHATTQGLCKIRARACMVYTLVMWSVDVELIADWLDLLDRDSWVQVMAGIEVLRDMGPQLGRPLVDTVTASKHKNMKELWPGSSGRSSLRILFAFDPERRAIMLIAGDKSGNWTRWYRQAIPMADELFDEHLRTLKAK